MKISIKNKNPPLALKAKPPKAPTRKEMSVISGKSIEETYCDKELRQHIYDSPDTYAGSIEPNKELVWVFNELESIMQKKEITFIEAFYKIFDEILVNAIDHHHRVAGKIAKGNKSKLRPVKNIRVWLDRETGWITVENDGDGIEIFEHPKNKLYLPEMLFGNLLTSINYGDEEERTVGGKNGYGAKICNILSKEFIIETVDPHRGLKFYQEYSNNMLNSTKAKIEKYSRVPFTRIKYLPDYKRFGISDFKTIDDWSLLARRVYDASACTDKSCNVYLNDNKIATKTFEDYVGLYIGNKRERKRVYNVANRWEVAVCLSPDGEFEQISFVNGICTDRGGKHVDHVTLALTKKIAADINAKAKKGSATITPAVVKKNIWVFIKSTINKPSFDTQTKRLLTTLVSKFGSRCELPDSFIEKCGKLGISKRAMELAEFKAKKVLSSKTDGKAVRRVNDPKLVDAPWAQSAKTRSKAILILTEGDSAARFFTSGIAGLPKSQQARWGCFPLRGKLLNVRRATLKQLEKNEEIMKIKKIMGLKEGIDYSNSINGLRYGGGVMILADEDKDGKHIKGLIINFLQTYWPSLLLRKGFVSSFSTPVVKVWPRSLGDRPDPKKTTNFFSETDYENWKKNHQNQNTWIHKFYKGLGTHGPREAQECFKNMRVTNYTWGDQTVTYQGQECNASEIALKLTFEKNHEDARKKWLLEYFKTMPDEPKTDIKEESVADFINKRMITFSHADVIRSVPEVTDGLKPSQRKILYTILTQKYKQAVKIIKLTGDVMSVAAYHHGDASAHETAINMANDYVGSNNCNLLDPIGQYGTRTLKGKDHASARYIFTNKMSYLDTLFNKYDRMVLKPQIDDGQLIEPVRYIPTIPLILANGSEGIGTGWSSDIPCFNVEDIVNNLRARIDGKPMVEMVPYYRGFNGEIVKVAKNKYMVLGRWSRTGKNSIRIDDLPVGTKMCKSFIAYKEYVTMLAGEQSLKKPKKDKDDDDDDSKSTKSGFGKTILQDFKYTTETSTKLGVEMTFVEGFLDSQLSNNPNYNFERKMKIAVSMSTANMHAFYKGCIKKYSDPLEMIEDYFPMRYELYVERKKYILNELEHDLAINDARYRFMMEIMEEKINIYRKKKADIIKILDGTAEQGAADPAYPVIINANKDKQDGGNYEYLLSMRVDSFSYEKLEKLRERSKFLENEIKNLKAKSIEQMWHQELDEFIEMYRKETEKWIETHKLEIMPKRKQLNISNKNSDKDSVVSDLDPVENIPDVKNISLKNKLMKIKPKNKSPVTKININKKPKTPVTVIKIQPKMKRE